MLLLNNFKIKTKIIVATLASISVSVIAVITILVLMFISFMNESYNNEAEQTSSKLAVSLEMGLNSGDFESVKKSFDYVKKDKRVAMILIISNDSLFTGYPENIKYSKSLLNSDTMIVETTKINTTMIENAYAIVGFSLGELNSRIEDLILMSSLILLVVLLLSFIISSFLGNSIAKPIKQVTYYAEQIASGNITNLK